MARTLPWPIAVEPTSSGERDLDRLGKGARGLARHGGRRVPAVAHGRAHDPLGADLHAERREHRVARVGEAVLERPAARLAVGVLQLDAVDHGRRLDRERAARPDRARLEGGCGGHDLEGRPRGLGRREGEAGERPDLARARVERGDAAEPAGERRHRGLLHVGVDRGAHGRGLARLGARHHARAGEQHATRHAAEAGVECALEPVLADGPVARETARVEAALARPRVWTGPSPRRSTQPGRRAASCARPPALPPAPRRRGPGAAPAPAGCCGARAARPRPGRGRSGAGSTRRSRRSPGRAGGL